MRFAWRPARYPAQSLMAPAKSDRRSKYQTAIGLPQEDPSGSLPFTNTKATARKAIARMYQNENDIQTYRFSTGCKTTIALIITTFLHDVVIDRKSTRLNSSH